MELRHLENFVAVAEELNFTRAARRLHLAQSAVSAAIRALERELGAPLFERDSKRVTLTGAGAVLLPEARATLAAAQAARDAVGEAGGGLRGTVNVGAMISVGILDLPALFGEFHARHPGVDIRVGTDPRGSAGLAQSVLEGRLDVAFVSLPGRAPGGLSVRELATVPLVVVLPATHLLADAPEVDLAALADEAFVDSPVGYGTRTVVDREFADAGIARHVAIEVIDIGTVPAYVRNGVGVALLPSFVVPHDVGLSVRPIAGRAPRWALSVATATDRRSGAAVRALLSMVDGHVHVGEGDRHAHD